SKVSTEDQFLKVHHKSPKYFHQLPPGRLNLVELTLTAQQPCLLLLVGLQTLNILLRQMKERRRERKKGKKKKETRQGQDSNLRSRMNSISWEFECCA